MSFVFVIKSHILLLYRLGKYIVENFSLLVSSHLQFQADKSLHTMLVLGHCG